MRVELNLAGAIEQQVVIVSVWLKLLRQPVFHAVEETPVHRNYRREAVYERDLTLLAAAEESI